ncbi:hypothetical protein SAMN04487948_106113 [Halogranum amylolyticum]|uniref:Uncharacterized protein n=1 Tax=Halogranum amylolyticum TaxID=660520 RepID=A0A1H8T9W4_9EURY|nr:hypothetical protein [Halogranum amylolyticum]SEO87671.1 hypothetical protein SAMN04487948_106113 [Halogranum amylolyticum]
MDSYRRGKQVERDQTRPRVRSRYRPILPVIWTIGTVLAFLVLPFGWDAVVAVVFVLHLFFAGLVHGDIRALRRQGLEWGFTRHLWFAAAFVLPLVALAYYVYSGRRIAAENERRNTGDGEAVERRDAAESADGRVESE